MHNPYRPTAVPLEQSPLTVRPSKGFPFSLVARWIVAALVVAYAVVRLVDLVNGWSLLTDRAIIDLASNPFIRLAAESCVLLTGILLWRGSKFVFIPLLGHIAIFLWFVFGFGPIQRLPGVIFVVWAAQSALLGFCLWLLLQQRLR